jgi:RNase P protein component
MPLHVGQYLSTSETCRTCETWRLTKWNVRSRNPTLNTKMDVIIIRKKNFSRTTIPTPVEDFAQRLSPIVPFRISVPLFLTLGLLLWRRYPRSLIRRWPRQWCSDSLAESVAARVVVAPMLLRCKCSRDSVDCRYLALLHWQSKTPVI